MTDTKQLLERIAALRTRLDDGTDAPGNPGAALAEKVQRGAVHNGLIEHALHIAESHEPAPPTAMRLTARGARLLRKGRDLLHSLRSVADDVAFQRADESDAVARLHHEGMAMIEVLLRTVQAFPPAVSVQLRMCDRGVAQPAKPSQARVGTHRRLGEYPASAGNGSSRWTDAADSVGDDRA